MDKSKSTEEIIRELLNKHNIEEIYGRYFKDSPLDSLEMFIYRALADRKKLDAIYNETSIFARDCLSGILPLSVQCEDESKFEKYYLTHLYKFTRYCAEDSVYHTDYCDIINSDKTQEQKDCLIYDGHYCLCYHEPHACREYILRNCEKLLGHCNLSFTHFIITEQSKRTRNSSEVYAGKMFIKHKLFEIAEFETCKTRADSIIPIIVDYHKRLNPNNTNKFLD